ncbi:biotin transporter BioY [Anthocerotibacter panamensis]|uniref:biotin transporter BioY n=1 Tax=Anthocerotibacter panamensis TaxID=2857077 RepID=UPI001C401B5F|nr:biotin transporter BioY [Anthocerotibacter panamensis]
MSSYRVDRRRARRRRWPLPTLADLLWAALGLELTVAGTLVQLYLPDSLPQAVFWQWPPVIIWSWEPSYVFSLQVAAVLLTAVAGGPLAGFLAQVAYLALGLWKFPLFYEGGGLEYLHHPAIGYLFGFIPGAWLTGVLAFRQQSSLNWLASSCLAGLAAIHLSGVVGLISHYGWSWNLLEAVTQYSLLPLLGQFIGILGVSLVGFGLRRLFFT